jgi:hypothetical protein
MAIDIGRQEVIAALGGVAVAWHPLLAQNNVQSLLSMCAPNLPTSHCEEMDWYARIAD